jgi:hypothetical protein
MLLFIRVITVTVVSLMLCTALTNRVLELVLLGLVGLLE